jgi:hypothetical protein
VLCGSLFSKGLVLLLLLLLNLCRAEAGRGAARRGSSSSIALDASAHLLRGCVCMRKFQLLRVPHFLTFVASGSTGFFMLCILLQESTCMLLPPVSGCSACCC